MNGSWAYQRTMKLRDALHQHVLCIFFYSNSVGSSYLSLICSLSLAGRLLHNYIILSHITQPSDHTYWNDNIKCTCKLECIKAEPFWYGMKFAWQLHDSFHTLSFVYLKHICMVQFNLFSYAPSVNLISVEIKHFQHISVTNRIMSTLWFSSHMAYCPIFCHIFEQRLLWNGMSIWPKRVFEIFMHTETDDHQTICTVNGLL